MVKETRGDYGLVRRTRLRYCESLPRRVDRDGRLAGRRHHDRRTRLRMAPVSVGQARDRGRVAAERRDVHGAQRVGLASRRAGGEELRPEAGLRNPVGVRVAADRGALRERRRRQLRRHRPAETARRDSLSRPVAGVAHGVGFGAGPQAARRVDRVAVRRRGDVLRRAEVCAPTEDEVASGTSTARPPCWTGARCIRSNGSNC